MSSDAVKVWSLILVMIDISLYSRATEVLDVCICAGKESSAQWEVCGSKIGKFEMICFFL